MEPMLLRAEEVAKVLGLGRSKVFEMLRANELPVVRIGRSPESSVPVAQLERWIQERQESADC
jgi:excisionase family DNA binding protein